MPRLRLDGQTVRHAVGSWQRTARLCTLLLVAGTAPLLSGAAALLIMRAFAR